MRIDFATLETCHTARGVVVAIDVCRAFTTAAAGLMQGARRIYLTGAADEALALKASIPNALLMGEVDGLPAPGFDMWNSPATLAAMNLTGRTLIHRTSAGTRGIVQSSGAQHLFGASFIVAAATARAILALEPREVTFVITGASPDDPRYGQEDRACAEYIAALLRGEQPDPRPYLDYWMSDLFAVHPIDALPEPLRSTFYADLALCRAVNRLDFAMPVRRDGELFIIDRQ